MNIEFDAYKQKLNDCRPALLGLADSLNLEGMRNELERLHAMQEAPGFWDDPEKSQKVVVKTKQTEAKVERYEKMLATWEDLMTICEMAAEEDDDSMLDELKDGFEKLAENMETCRLETLLTGHYDKNNALMSFHAGAGGTEAQDWAQMLYRMYTRWAERHGFTYKIMDYQEGDEAGLKSADILIEGENAYGFLKGENGVHRLVRVSPFGLPLLRRRRPAHQQDLLRRSSDPQAHGHRSFLPDPAGSVPEQGNLYENAALQAG